MRQGLVRFRRKVALAVAIFAVLLAARAGLYGQGAGHVILALMLCVLAFGLFKNHSAAFKVAGLMCLVFAMFLPIGVFNPFAVGDYLAAGEELPSFPGALLWVVPMEILLLASAYVLDLPAGDKHETPRRDFIEADTRSANPNWRTPLFLAAQVVPPTLMFLFVFGHWGVGVSLIIGVPMLYSACRIPLLLYRRRFRLLPRPVLTLLFAIGIIGMGNYYAAQSARYVDQLALEIHEQCNRDDVCKLPSGKWASVGDAQSTLFVMHTTGLVPMRIVLTFNEQEPTQIPSCTGAFPNPECQKSLRPAPSRVTSFHLMRQLEDNDYDAYGGVGRSLNIPGRPEPQSSNSRVGG